MHRKLALFLDEYRMLQSGDTVYCAVSGGADSVALLWALYLLKDKRAFSLQAAHFNHHLRGEESDRDEAFVRELCHRFDIPLTVGHGKVTAGEKGLEAAAREARYAFFDTLPGKVATAHTADDNTETVLMHLIRGTGLKGLGGIAPVRGKYIRPMLSVTRREVLSYLREYHLSHITDSSNDSDEYLRNRLRHHVLPLLLGENPNLMNHVSFMARQLRLDEEALTPSPPQSDVLDVQALRQMHPAPQARFIAAYLARFGIHEPTSGNIWLIRQLIDSDNPSAYAYFPNGVLLCRSYDKLYRHTQPLPLSEAEVPNPGSLEEPAIGLKVICRPAHSIENSGSCFTVCPQGKITVRCRKSGDTIRLPGGTKTLKKLFIDRKIPAAQRELIPVIADELGVLGVFGIGVNLDRIAGSVPATQIRIEYKPTEIT